jgi:hypothetical protein
MANTGSLTLPVQRQATRPAIQELEAVFIEEMLAIEEHARSKPPAPVLDPTRSERERVIRRQEFEFD